MELVLFWVIFSSLAGYYATTKRRSGIGWFLFSMVLSPLIALIFLLILPGRESTNNSLKSKLLEIEKLRDDGLITEDEYASKRKLIIESN